MIKKIKVLSLFLFLGMIISVFAQNNDAWDFANYHYYNAYAFLNNRLEVDIAPASVNTFFNPLIELPLYFFIKYFNDFPYVIFALQGIWFGLYLFIFFKICNLFFVSKNKNIWVILCLLIAITGQATFFQIGSCTNEIPVAFLDLCGLYLLLKMVKNPETQNVKDFFYSGLLFGIGLGLKLTSIHCCLAVGFTLICCRKYLKQYVQSVSIFAVAGLVGFLVVHGYFMYKYWAMFGNPAFPFLNVFFHSPFFDNVNYIDKRFVPAFSQFLIYPFFFNFNLSIFDKGILFDFRLTFLYVLMLIILLLLLLKGNMGQIIKNNKVESFLFVFMVFDYLLWMKLFSIHRYAILLESLFSLFVVQCVQKVKNKNIFVRIVISLFFLILIANPYYWIIGNQKNLEWHKFPFGKKYLEIEEIQLPENSLVKLYNLPNAFVIPYLNNKGVHFTGHMQIIEKQNADFAERGEFRKKRDELEKKYQGKAIIVYTDSSPYSLVNKKYYSISEQKKMYVEKERSIFQSHNPNLIKLWLDELVENVSWYKIRDELEQEMKSDYSCQPLNNNIIGNLVICVPNELKDEILGKNSTKN